MFDKKILCLGNNDASTDLITTKLATENHTVNQGLITDSDFLPSQPGYYHTTIVDIFAGGVVQLAAKFDSIILLDQPADQ
jgi:hypothetical protein